MKSTTLVIMAAGMGSRFGNQTALTEKIKGKVTGSAKRRSKDKRNCGKYF